MSHVYGNNKEERLLSLMERTGYNIVQENGQRLFGPPPNWTQLPPSKGCEVFVGKIPRDVFEDELVPVLLKVGQIYLLRLMMDFSGTNRGFAFVTYTNQNDAKRAIIQLNGYEIRPNKRIGVVKSIDNCRLFIGRIPLDKTRQDVIEELSKVTEGVVNAIVYNNTNNNNVSSIGSNNLNRNNCYANRGFTFVEYMSHKAAAMARRKLLPGKIHLWGTEVTVDWAVPEPNLDEETMSKVTVLYVRNLSPLVHEEKLKEMFTLGSMNFRVEKVKKLRDFAFVHYATRKDAENALQVISKMNLSSLANDGQQLEVTWAKPPNNNNYNNKRRIKQRNQGLMNYNNYNQSGVPMIPQTPTLSPLYGFVPLFSSMNQCHQKSMPACPSIALSPIAPSFEWCNYNH